MAPNTMNTGRRCGWSRVEITEGSTEDDRLVFLDEDPIDEDPGEQPDEQPAAERDDGRRLVPPPHLRLVPPRH
jgi:hypothetical protein